MFKKRFALYMVVKINQTLNNAYIFKPYSDFFIEAGDEKDGDLVAAS